MQSELLESHGTKIMDQRVESLSNEDGGVGENTTLQWHFLSKWSS